MGCQLGFYNVSNAFQMPYITFRRYFIHSFTTNEFLLNMFNLGINKAKSLKMDINVSYNIICKQRQTSLENWGFTVNIV